MLALRRDLWQGVVSPLASIHPSTGPKLQERCTIFDMPVKVHKPGYPLSQYVERIWWTANVGMPSSRQRVYPDGAMALVIHLDKPAATYFIGGEAHRILTPLLAGPYTRSFHFDPSQSTAVIGVLFRPGAARLFFPVAAHELHNLDIALGELDSTEADRLLNELCSAPGEDALFRAVERYLNRKLANAAPIPPAVRYAVAQLSREGAVRGVRKVQFETGLSHTRLIQLFREHVGLTPKLFCRVRRFRALLDRIDCGLPVNWAQLAADCGYFDQAHLIHDFRAFAGITPAKYGRTLINERTDQRIDRGADQDRRYLAATAAS